MTNTSKLIENMTAEEKMKNLNTLNYIKTLASNSSVNILDWNLLQIFQPENGQEGTFLVSDKKEINKRFFAYYEQAKEEAKKQNLNPEEMQNSSLELDKIKNDFINVSKASRRKQMQKLKDNLIYEEEEIRRQENQLSTTTKNYIEHGIQIRSLEETVDTDTKALECLAGIQTLINERIWINPVYQNGMLYLNTSVPVLLHEVNKNANLDLHIDLGYFAARINVVGNFNFSVIPYRNNIVARQHFHPHIKPEGTICWGEAVTVATKHIANLELDKTLRLLHQLLNSYNAGSPYVPLADFKLSSQKMNNIPIGLKHPDKDKKVEAPKPEEKKDVSSALAQGILVQVAPVQTLTSTIVTTDEINIGQPRQSEMASSVNNPDDNDEDDNDNDYDEEPDEDNEDNE